MDQLTPIPVNDGENGAERALFHDVESHTLPKEFIAVSWALLLSSCTIGQSQSPVIFLLNGQPIKVDIATRTIQSANLEISTSNSLSPRNYSLNSSTSYTAVWIEESDSESASESQPHTITQGSGTDLKDYSEPFFTTPSSSSSSFHSPSSSSASISSLPSTAALSWTVNRKSQMSVLHSTGMDAATLHRLGSQLKQIVHEQVAHSGTQVELHAPESPALSISNHSPELLPGPQLLHELALSGSTDSNNAIEFLTADGNIRYLSYSSLDQLSSKLATEIVQASTARVSDGRKLVVPVLLPQSLELYITWLGILKAGGAFCPLNIDAPPDRIEFILQDVAASVVVTQGSLATRVPQDEHLAVIKVEDIVNSTDETQTSNPPTCVVKSSPSDLAYVMYTSGSTGRPKGVGISHLAATQSLLAHNDLIPHFNRFLQFASPTFDVSVFEVFFPFFRGATLIGSDREQMLLDISHVMTKMEVDAAELTPTVAGELLRTRAAAPCLKVLLTIGEMLTKHVVEEFGRSDTSDGILHGMYGPTEAAIHCTAATNFSADSAVNLIGKPFKTVSAFIMSLESDEKSSGAPAELQVLPIGQIGELVVGGPQLADGYINRPEENAKAFIESPIYGRLYRTGDKARMSSNGDIECFGRISSGQVKLRGQRIELGEIENVICKSSNVRSAVAIVSGGSLAAFVLANDQGTTDRDLRDTCRQLLPRFMVPGEFILIDQFPQLPSGKIDRKGLEAEFVRRREAAQSVEQITFRDEVEETIVSCVFDVLGKKIPVDDSLVSAGLDSLAAIRLASHLLDAGIRLDVARLLEADSVDGIWHLTKEQSTSESSEDTQTGIKQIRQLVADAGAARIEALGLSARASDIEPCSHIQQAMILETVRDSKAYSNWIELEFQPDIFRVQIHHAFEKLFERNALLRSGFVEIGLKENTYARFIWSTLDDRTIQTCEKFDYDISLISGNDLLYPLRIQLKESDEGVRVLVHIHHALYDGWSWQLMLKDLERILRGEDITSKPAYSIITDFFLEYKLSESATDSSNFWRDHLQGTSALSFPNFHSTTNTPPRTQEASRALDISVSKLNEVSQSLRVGRQSIFQAAYCYILSTYLGSKDVCFGTVFSGRTLPVKGIETVLGPCIRTLPTRMDLDKMQNVTDLMLAIQNTNRKSLEHGSLPLSDIKKASGIDPRTNLFDTAIVWQESIWSEDRDENAPFNEVGAAEFLEFAFLLDLEPREDEIIAKMSFQESILPYEQAQLLLEQIDSVASILLDNPLLSIDEVSSHLSPTIMSISNAQLDKTTKSQNSQTSSSSLIKDIKRLSSTNPTQTAIEILTQTETNFTPTQIQKLSYTQLEHQSNCIANWLIGHEIEKGERIAIFIDNSLDSYATILGLIKLGAGLLILRANDSWEYNSSLLAAIDASLCIFPQSTKWLFDQRLPHKNGVLATRMILPEYDLLYRDCRNDRNERARGNEDAFHVFVPVNDSLGEGQSASVLRFSIQDLESHLDSLVEAWPVVRGSKVLNTGCFTSSSFFVDLIFAWKAGIAFCSVIDGIETETETETKTKTDTATATGTVNLHLRNVVNAMDITHLHSTPSLIHSLNPEQVPSLKHILTSGETLRMAVRENWVGNSKFPIPISSGYTSEGMLGVVSLCSNVENVTSASIGLPLRNAFAMIVAENDGFDLLPRGALGEVCFSGDQIGRSDTGKFIDHPEYGPIYRTVDRGRILSDGTITLDSSLKVSGQFIDIDEIDRALLSSGLVQDSVSIVLETPHTDQQQLATIWTPTEKAQESTSSKYLDHIFHKLRTELTTRLSTSSLPSFLIRVDQIPMNKSHLVDFVKIREDIQQMDPENLSSFSLQLETEESDPDSDTAFNEIEQIIASALSTVTGMDLKGIRRHTSFYKIGLDSLSAISFSRTLQENGIERLPVSTILQRSSIAQLAAVAKFVANGHVSLPMAAPADNDNENGPGSVFDEDFIRDVKDELEDPAQDRRVKNVYPCTPLQEAMLAAKSDAESAYFNHLLLRVNVDIEQLKSAWTNMLERHDILRTCFRPTSDSRFAYAQIVLEGVSLPWSSSEVSPQGLVHDVEKRKSEFESRSPVQDLLPYSLTIYVDTAANTAHLLLSIHHALYDGEGIAQLLHELQTLLASQSLPETTPFHQFINYMLSTNTESSDTYWDRYLSGIAPRLLPSPIKTSVDSTASQQIQASLNVSFSTFKTQCKTLSVTPLNVFHASWARLLSFYADSSDICFGNVFSCRTIPLEGASQIVGPCFNTLPMRVKLRSTSTNADMMKQCQKHNADILPYQLTPLRRVQKRVLDGGAGSKLFDTLIILQTRGTDLDPQYWELLSDEGNMGFPLICEVIPDEKNDVVSISLHFQKSYLEQDIVERLARDFVDIVAHTTSFPSSQASDKRLIGGEDVPKIFEKSGNSQVVPQIQSTRPWSSQEETIRDIVGQYSRVDLKAIQLHTTIFQLGLDSINAVQVSGKLYKMGYKVSAGDILEAASVDKIASLLDQRTENNKEAEFDFSAFENKHLHTVCEQLKISSTNVQSLRPCTPVQNGMLASFTHSNGSMYFNRMALKAPMPLSRALLKEAWSAVMSQHEMLRTGFVQLHDQEYPFAMITYESGVELPWHELKSGSMASFDSQGQRMLENFHQPTWAITIESSNDEVTDIHFSALHAIYDAQSLTSIFTDVMESYEGKALSKKSSINSTLGPILLESHKDNKESPREFWQSLAPEAQPTKIPDLNPIRLDKKELFEKSIHSSSSLDKLEDSCRKMGVTLQAAGQVAWARLLSAYTGEQNVTFGTVLSGRNLSSEAQDAVFPCLVTVPSPQRISGSNRELLERTLKRNANLVKHQFTPLAQIQRWFGHDEPLFDTLFVYQKFASGTAGIKSWEIVDEDTRIDYPLSIELVPHATDLEIRISYRGDIIPEEQAKILLDQYNKLLEQTVFSPETESDDYQILGNKLLSVTPAKEISLPTSVSLLHQFVEQNAVRVPEKAALEFAFGSSIDNLQKKIWSYREFNEDGNRVAHFLQERGVVTGGRVAICFDKCPEASIAILGILKAGCAYVAIDPTAPISRKQFILKDSDSKLLLCNMDRKFDLNELSDVDIQALDEPGLFASYSPEQPTLSREIRPDDTSYCLYTSGTTGTPKGCELTHDNAVQAMLAFQRLFSPHWDEDSRWLQFASFHFDVSVLEQYWSWSVGICVTSCPRDLLFEDLPGMIQKLQITHIDLTPSLARLVHPDEVPSLCRGVFITGGEALKQEILDAWGKHGVIYNGYGPTEVTIGCTMLPRMRANDKPTNIGPQFDNVGSYVFRPGTSTPVLRGGIGELCVSGPLVGKGYLNRAELTVERFQTLPEWNDRIYRTGDLVRILHDGTFQFLGRLDDQVKLRGQRLEIGEINEVIKQSTPVLNEVATLVVKHPSQSKDQLVSFVTKVGDKDKKSRNVEVISSRENQEFLSIIKTACHTHLPGYMVPTHIIPMSRFPLSANNKADMKVLKGIFQELSLEDIQNLNAMTVDRGTKSLHEEKIISILAQFIGATDSAISSWSSIYELGLDSISVLSFARSLREAGFSQAQPSLIMKHPTVSGLSTALQEAKAPSTSFDNLHKHSKQAMEAFAHKHAHSVMESVGVADGDVEQIAPCTPLQEGIIYHFLSSPTPLYCSSFTFELKDSVDLARLQAAWSQAQCQVQVLRTRFSPSPDGYAQIVLKEDALPWFHRELTSDQDKESTRKQETQRWISGLDSLMTQLWEVGVITSPESRLLCLNIFHALYDGNSLRLLLELVSRIYLGETEGVSSELPPNFLDVLHLGPLCKDPSEEGFWKDHLANYKNKPLPRSNDSATGPTVQNVQFDGTEALDHLRKSLNITEQAILHACWLLTLYDHYSFVPSLGIIASGRTIDVPKVTDVIGPLFNTIPSNIQLRGLKSWSEVAQRCHEYHASTIPFQYTALRDIVRWLGKNPDEPLFESLFVFQRDNAEGKSPTSALWNVVDGEAQHEYPLAFEIVRNGNQSLTITLAAKSNILAPETAQKILSHFQQILSELAENPEKELPYINGVADHEIVLTNGHTDVPQELPVSDIPEDTSFNWTSKASMIRDVIANLAGVEAQSISPGTSIFEVGLDSIDAIKLSSRLSKVGIRLPVSSIMRHRNVKAMSAQLVEEEAPEQNGSYPKLTEMTHKLTEFLERESLIPEGTRQILPATPIQEAMVAEMTASNFQHYYNHEILQLEPHVDLERLREAWRVVVKSHPILRTSFVEVWDPKIPASYAQIVHGEDSFDFQILELNGEPVDSIIQSQRVKASSQLSNSPLLTLTAAVDGDHTYLVLSISHALYDGWSINLLHEDVARAYRGEDCTRPRPDAILEQILGSSGERSLKFWRAMLSNCTPVPFPSGMNAENNSDVVHRAEHQFPVSSEKAEIFCRRHGITMQALLVSCWSLVLATQVKKLDVIFGLVLSGRNVAESENVMFPTMNTVAMRVILHGTRLELVKYVQETLLEMSEHQHFPLRRARPDMRAQNLFDTLFIYQKRPSDESTEAQKALYKSTGGASEVDYPVCVEVEGVEKELVGRVACRGSVLGEKDTVVLLEQMAHVLSSIIDEESKQTVEFSGEAMTICGHSVVQDAPEQVVQNGVLPQTNGQTKWSPIESTIRSVLSVVSGVPEDTIHKTDNIFQLGLDSISAIKVAALLKKQSIKLTVSDMLRESTIEKMARAVNNGQAELTQKQILNALDESLTGIDIASLVKPCNIDLQQIQKAMPATAGQSYFLAMHSLNPTVFYPAFYYLSSSLLKQETLNNAWTRLIGQTPILRTAFVPTNDQVRLPYVQVVIESASTPIIWHEDINGLNPSALIERGFGSVPATLHACQTPNGTALTLHIHHALYDAVSLPLIMDKLSQLCDSVSNATDPTADSRDISHLVALQHLHSPIDARRQFWQRYLGQISMSDNENQRLGNFGPIQQFYRPGLVPKMSNIELAAKHQGISVQSIFLAVYARVHARVFAAGESETVDVSSHSSSQRPLVVGLYLANRSHVMEDLTELMAPTLNIVPLRLDSSVQDSDSLFTTARKIQSDINEISRVENSSVSLAEIAEWTGIRINVCVNFLRLPELEEEKEKAQPEPLNHETTINARIRFKSIQHGDLQKSHDDQSRTNGMTTAAPALIETNQLAVSAAISDIFMPTIDVEAAVRDGQLDFGLFAPDSRLTPDDAERVIEGMYQEMVSLTELEL